MEIIEPWQLYLILQADNIAATAGGLTTMLGVLCITVSVALVAGVFVHGASEGTAGIRPSTLWRCKWRLLLFYAVVPLSHLVVALMPDTKTAAIMFGVPAVINNPTFQQETGEVYQLLKKALSDTVQKKEQEKKE